MADVILLTIDTHIDTHINPNQFTSIGMRTGTRAHSVVEFIGRRPPVRCEHRNAVAMSRRVGSTRHGEGEGAWQVR